MKEEILKLRLEGKSYKEIERQLGCARSTIAFHCQKQGLNTPVRNSNPRGAKAIKAIKADKKIKYCENCGIEVRNKGNKKVCSLKCSATLTGRRRYEKYIENWKLGIVSGGNENHGNVSKHVRRYLFEKYGSKCSLCGWSEVNKYTQTIPLEVDHIDGNPINHKEENLTLLCPNCHSLTSGHSTSKGNGRRYYREKYHKENNGVRSESESVKLLL